MFEIATKKDSTIKLLLWGPWGCFKTLTALGLCHQDKEPAAAVLDAERGTDHFSEQFNFKRSRAMSRTDIEKDARELIANPQGIQTLIFDPFSNYYSSLVTWYNEKFSIREISGAGQKKDYYRLQPADWGIINHEAEEFVKEMIAAPLNMIFTCHAKNEWEGLKVIGQTFDSWQGLAYYFDTIIEISGSSERGWVARLSDKDRTGGIKTSTIPWKSPDETVKFLKSTGFNFLRQRISSPPVTVSETPPQVVEPAATRVPNMDEKKPWPKMVTEESLKILVELYNCLGFTKAEWLASLSRYNATTARMLVEGQAVELIEALKLKVEAREQGGECPFAATTSPT